MKIDYIPLIVGIVGFLSSIMMASICYLMRNQLIQAFGIINAIELSLLLVYATGALIGIASAILIDKIDVNINFIGIFEGKSKSLI